MAFELIWAILDSLEMAMLAGSPFLILGLLREPIN